MQRDQRMRAHMRASVQSTLQSMEHPEHRPRRAEIDAHMRTMRSEGDDDECAVTEIFKSEVDAISPVHRRASNHQRVSCSPCATDLSHAHPVVSLDTPRSHASTVCATRS